MKKQGKIMIITGIVVAAALTIGAIVASKSGFLRVGTYGQVKDLLAKFQVTDEKIISQVASLPELAPFADPANKKRPTLTLIGHASLKLRTTNGTVIYIDPSFDGDYSEPANIILVTHRHDDHNQVWKCKKAPDCTVITWNKALVKGEYKTFQIGDIKIEAVPSGGNPLHSLQYDVGYIVTVDGVSILHPGDTSMNEKTKDISSKKIDYAFYPIEGRYTMEPEEATEVANLIGAAHNIPFHGDANGIVANYLDRAMRFLPQNKMIMLYGQTIYLK